MSSARKLLQEALALPEGEREVLATALSDSLAAAHVELGPAWRDEIHARLGALERGEVELVSWESIEQRILRSGE
jgi:putative addiction module component (TIGR02574 family)